MLVKYYQKAHSSLDLDLMSRGGSKQISLQYWKLKININRTVIPNVIFFFSVHSEDTQGKKSRLSKNFDFAKSEKAQTWFDNVLCWHWIVNNVSWQFALKPTETDFQDLRNRNKQNQERNKSFLKRLTNLSLSHLAKHFIALQKKKN